MATTFGIGTVLATGFRIWFRNLVPFLMTALVIYAPLVIWGTVTVEGELDRDHFVAFEAGRSILVWPLDILVSAAVTYGVVMELQGQRASFGAGVGVWLRRLLPVLGVMLLIALVDIGLAICTMPLHFLNDAAYGIAMFVTWLWALTVLWVAPQASVIERPGLIGALGRSRALTKGHRLAVFAIVILFALTGYGLQHLVQRLAVPNLRLYEYLSLARQLVLGSLSSVVASVTYYALRVERDGPTSVELATVFD